MYIYLHVYRSTCIIFATCVLRSYKLIIIYNVLRVRLKASSMETSTSFESARVLLEQIRHCADELLCKYEFHCSNTPRVKMRNCNTLPLLVEAHKSLCKARKEWRMDVYEEPPSWISSVDDQSFADCATEVLELGDDKTSEVEIEEQNPAAAACPLLSQGEGFSGDQKSTEEDEEMEFDELDTLIVQVDLDNFDEGRENFDAFVDTSNDLVRTGEETTELITVDDDVELVSAQEIAEIKEDSLGLCKYMYMYSQLISLAVLSYLRLSPTF